MLKNKFAYTLRSIDYAYVTMFILTKYVSMLGACAQIGSVRVEQKSAMLSAPARQTPPTRWATSVSPTWPHPVS